jgi:hypothetical protein
VFLVQTTNLSPQQISVAHSAVIIQVDAWMASGKIAHSMIDSPEHANWVMQGQYTCCLVFFVPRDFNACLFQMYVLLI